MTNLPLLIEELRKYNLVISKPDGRVVVPENFSSEFADYLRCVDMPHIRFHDMRHSAATNIYQLTGDFFAVSQILGHTLKGIGIELGISGNLDTVTAQYVDVRLDRKKEVLSTYHEALFKEAVFEQHKPPEPERGGRDDRGR